MYSDALEQKFKRLPTCVREIDGDPIELFKTVNTQAVDFHESKYGKEKCIDIVKNMVSLYQKV